MSIVNKIGRALRGEATPKTVALESLRRGYSLLQRRRDRASVERWVDQPARLNAQFERMEPAELLEHFRNRSQPRFLPGFSELDVIAQLQQKLFPAETTELIKNAERIVNDHTWPLLGLGEKGFGDPIDWHRDPVNGIHWPLEYHADINLTRNDGSDIRMLWELNRLPHFLTLARAYVLTNDERYSAELLRQLQTWKSQNPFGRGANWSCAMEVGLRAMNLIAAMELIRHSQQLNERMLASLLAMFDQHGEYITKNLEFSYIITSNHYLSDVIGLLWLGLMLPELEAAEKWRDFGLRETLSEMDKQVLPDGADFESSTAYHRFVLELFLYTFILCRANGIEIQEKCWRKLRDMLAYMNAYLKPEGLAPLIGDSDSGQVLPIRRRAGNDHAYVLAIGAAAFKETRFKQQVTPIPEELLWILGEQGVREFEKLQPSGAQESHSFPHAGTFVMCQDDLYLLLNTSGAGLKGRGSHGHNDALSIEVSACGTSFIVDPGTYFYKPNLHERHLFRSTAFHSTVEIDAVDQNTTIEALPFAIGNEAQGRVLRWETKPHCDVVVAEQVGYERLPGPVVHRRTVYFRKQQRFWIVEDSLTGRGQHEFRFRFHFAPGLQIEVIPDGKAEALDQITGARLMVVAITFADDPKLEQRFSSSDYGEKKASVSACWTRRGTPPVRIHWAIVPICRNEDEDERLAAVRAWVSDFGHIPVN
jgi:hypothetical protein